MSEAVGTISKRMNLITSCRRLVGRLKLGRAQKLVVAVVGGSVVLVGIAMLVLPARLFWPFRRAWRFWRRSLFARGAG